MMVGICTSKLQYADVHSILSMFDVDIVAMCQGCCIEIAATLNSRFCQDIKFVVSVRLCTVECAFCHTQTLSLDVAHSTWGFWLCIVSTCCVPASYSLILLFSHTSV